MRGDLTAACADTSTWNRPTCIKRRINRSTWRRRGSYIIFSARRSCQLALAGSADCCREGWEGVAGASSESKQTSLCVRAVGRIYGSDDATVRQTHLLRFCCSQFWMEGPPRLQPIKSSRSTFSILFIILFIYLFSLPLWCPSPQKKISLPFSFSLVIHKFSLGASATTHLYAAIAWPPRG